MLHQNTLNFLKNLKDNNSRQWLDQNHLAYENAKNDILALADQLIASTSKIDKTILNAFLEPKHCVTRLNRDLRFAKFKIPYKTDYYIVLNKNGKKSTSAFYYLHIEPGNCFVGGGVYNPQSLELRKIRKYISQEFKSWSAIIGNKSFQKAFPSGIHSPEFLRKAARNFEVDDPAAEFLKMKGFYTMTQLSDEQMSLSVTFEQINSYFKAATPLVDFLNQAIENDNLLA